jgi:hypothetical protein
VQPVPRRRATSAGASAEQALVLRSVSNLIM